MVILRILLKKVANILMISDFGVKIWGNGAKIGGSGAKIRG